MLYLLFYYYVYVATYVDSYTVLYNKIKLQNGVHNLKFKVSVNALCIVITA